jgi:uncharacterized membrane protein YcgQ (UPF0703/DUF1980 family)
VRSKRSQLATRTFFAILPLLAILSGCGGPGVPIQRNSAGTKSVTLSDTGSQDLEAADAVVEKNAVDKAEEPVFEIKEKMFIAQTNDVYLNPEDYMGRTIKLEGIFKSYAIEEYGAAYCFVVRYGPGCCGNDGNAGFEVAWDGTSETPYPEEDAWVEATGVLKSYDEDGYPYLYLSLSSLDVKEYRGTEFVSQ